MLFPSLDLAIFTARSTKTNKAWLIPRDGEIESPGPEFTCPQDIDGFFFVSDGIYGWAKPGVQPAKLAHCLGIAIQTLHPSMNAGHICEMVHSLSRKVLASVLSKTNRHVPTDKEKVVFLCDI